MPASEEWASGVASNPGAMPLRAARATRQGDSQQMNDPAVPIGELIQRARVRKNLSQARLAAKLTEVSGNRAVNQTKISDWEHGRRIPGPDWQGCLAEVLGLPPERLAAAAIYTRRRNAFARLAHELDQDCDTSEQ